MRPAEPIVEAERYIEDTSHLRLMSMLQELVREEGIMEAARVLEVNYRTVASTMQTGQPSKKMRWALERLQRGEGSAASEHWERTAGLKERVAKLEEDLHNGLEGLRTELEEQRQRLAGQREAHTRHRRRVERQLSVLVRGRTVATPEIPCIEGSGADGSEDVVTSNSPPWRRPADAARHKVDDLIQEWWLARNSLLAAEERLAIAMGWDMFGDIDMDDARTEAPAEPRTLRRRQLSKRKLGHSGPAEGALTLE